MKPFSLSRARVVSCGLFFFTLSTVNAQMVSVGVKAGVPLTADIEGSYGFHGGLKRYVVGPAFELRLPHSFAAEVDALYRRTGYDAVVGGLQSVAFERVRANSWEFPLLGKYYFRRSAAWQPFVGTGFAFRTIEIDQQGTILSPAPLLSPSPFSGSFREALNAGATVTAGLRLHYSKITILPQIRYTRWGGDQQRRAEE